MDQVESKEFVVERSARPAIVLLVIAVVAVLVFGLYQRANARKLAAHSNALTTQLSDTRSQMDALAARVNELSTQQQAAAPQPSPQLQAAAMETSETAERRAAERVRAKRVAARRARQAEEARWKKLQGQLDEHGNLITQTRADLETAKTELNGAIARTGEEVAILKRRGERDYFEFDIEKSKTFQHAGPISVRLKKAHTKKQYADLELMVDDVKLQKKHVNRLEPVSFYTEDSPVPIEIVVQTITKNHIRGYVSTPKYKRSQLAQMEAANASRTTIGATNNGMAMPVARKKLVNE